jgi:predicted nucleic acid-binding protein
MNEVFLDTVGIIAVWDESDQWHASADRSYQRLLAEGRRLITTTAVLYECGNAAARRQYRPRVGAPRQLFAQEQLLIDPTSEESEEA